MKRILTALAMTGVINATPASALSIKHDMGTATLPSVARRVVVSSEEVAEMLAVLEVKPVGYASNRVTGQLGKPTPNLASPVAASLQGVPYVGTFMQPSQEQIAKLKPDLILLTLMDGMESVYQNMSRLAPTIVYNPERTPWRDVLLKVGQAVGRSDKAKAFLSRYDERIRGLRAGLPASVRQHPRTTLIFMDMPNKAYIIGHKSNMAKQVAQLGLQLVLPAGMSPDLDYQEVSPEILSHLDTDRIVLFRKTIDGKKVPNNMVDTLLKRSNKPVIECPLDPQEADSGPLSDLKRLSALAPQLK